MEEMILYDGKWYKKGEEPDLGSLEAVETAKDGTIRHYQGLQEDMEKLPKYDDLATGSTATASDTGNYYTYVSATKCWYDPIAGEVFI